MRIARRKIIICGLSKRLSQPLNYTEVAYHNSCTSGYIIILLQVNGHDLTMATHKKAVEYIGRKPVLNLLVYRKGMPQLQPKQAPPQTSSYQSFPAVYRQHPVAQSSPANKPYYRQY